MVFQALLPVVWQPAIANCYWFYQLLLLNWSK